MAIYTVVLNEKPFFKFFFRYFLYFFLKRVKTRIKNTFYMFLHVLNRVLTRFMLPKIWVVCITGYCKLLICPLGRWLAAKLEASTLDRVLSTQDSTDYRVVSITNFFLDGSFVIECQHILSSMY